DGFELLDPGRAHDDRGDLLHAEQPRERQAGHRDPVLAGLSLELLERVEDRVLLETAVDAGAPPHAGAPGMRLARAVAPREPAAGERPERFVAEAVLVADGEDGLPVALLQQRVRGLHPLAADEALAD